jgi:hypothetical protein
MSQSQQPTNAPLLPEDRIELSRIIKVQDSEQSIWITPVCEFFKIGYDHHRKLIKNDPILQSIQRKKADYLTFGDQRQRILLPKLGFIRWIQLINPNTVTPELKEKFIKFQILVFDHVYGAAEQQLEEANLYAEINTKRSERLRLAREIRQAEAKLNRIFAAKYGQQQLQLEGGQP